MDKVHYEREEFFGFSKFPLGNLETPNRRPLEALFDFSPPLE